MSKKYIVTFKHTVEIEYTATVEADSEDQAEWLFLKDPFGFDPEEQNNQGIDIEIESIDENEE